MQTLLKFLALLMAISGMPGHASVLFEDGFESGALGPAWTVTSTNQGKVSVRHDYSPASGTGHLVFEDTVADGIYSVAQATFAVDLSNKKNAVLSFKAKSLGNEPHYPTYTGLGGAVDGNFDGISLSFDGGVTWYPFEYLSEVGSEWQSFRIDLDMMLYLTVEPMRDLRIRFSEYDNGPVPIDGIAIDDVLVTVDEDRRVILEMPSLVEGRGDSMAYVVLSSPAAEPLTLTFEQMGASLLNLPASVVIPAGQTLVGFPVSAVDDSLVNLERRITVVPLIEGDIHTSIPAEVLVKDDEVPPALTLTLPARVRENAGYFTAQISIASPIAVDAVFNFIASPASQVSSYYYQITIPAGATQTTFNVYPANDADLDGDVVVTLTSISASFPAATASMVIEDDDIPVLSLELPTALQEGTSAMGKVRVSGPMTHALTVALVITNGAGITLPATVTIPSGKTSVAFEIASVNDALRNLKKSFNLSASAAGATGATGTFVVLDDEPTPVVTFHPPADVTESGYGTIGITIDPVSDVDLNFSILTDHDDILYISGQLTIPAGESSLSLSVGVYNNDRIDDPFPVVLTFVSGALPDLTTTIHVLDDESRVLMLNLPYVREGTNDSGTVRISGKYSLPLVVNLSTADAGISLPASVTIPAGSTSATFSITSMDNDAVDGSREVAVTASAAAFITGSGNVHIIDNEPTGFTFPDVTDLMNAESQFTLTVNALANGAPLQGFAGAAELSLVLPDGSTRPVSTLNFTGASSWSGKVTLPYLAGSGYRLKVTGPGGVTASSIPFSFIRVGNFVTSDLIWDGSRGRIYASVPSSGGVNANKVIAIDPATLQITGSVLVGQNPGQLALTSDNGFLYVALNANGSIAKIDLSTMTVSLTFPLNKDATTSATAWYADDLCTVPGQPGLLVVSRYRPAGSPVHAGIAVYEGGVARSAKTADGAYRINIEPSADPTVFFANGSDNNFRKLKLGATGITQLSVELLDAYGSSDIRSDGDRVFMTDGRVVDGVASKRLGMFNWSGLVRPDLASGRVFFTTQSAASLLTFDPASLAQLQRYSMPQISGGSSFIRWGENGLAYRAAGSIQLIDNPMIVPSGNPADLAVDVQASDVSPAVGDTVNFSVTVTNRGPNTVRGAELKLSASTQMPLTFPQPAADGFRYQDGLASLTIGELASGQSRVISFTGKNTPAVPASLFLYASALSTAVDPDLTNNNSFAFINFGYPSGPEDSVRLGLSVNNVIEDPDRGVLWVTFPSSDFVSSLTRSLASINPRTGTISKPIPVGAATMPGAIALSSNGRYLYVGLQDVAEVARFDLSTMPPAATRIPLARGAGGVLNFASSIQVLDGDGTSFIVAGSKDFLATVYDGAVPRPVAASRPVSWLQKTATANLFVGHHPSYGTCRLVVDGNGVTSPQWNNSDLASGYRVAASGNLLLTEEGVVADSRTLVTTSRLFAYGVPCLDAAYQRAYLATAGKIQVFQSFGGSALGTLQGSSLSIMDTPAGCVRWGLDGIATWGVPGYLTLTRSPLIYPEGADGNGDGISDRWSMENLGKIKITTTADSDGDGLANAFEYLFGYSPVKSSKNPQRATASTQAGQPVMRFTFPRRSGVVRPAYGYEVSSDLSHWTAPAAVTESILSTSSVDGISMENVEAVITPPATGSAFVRLRWSK